MRQHRQPATHKTLRREELEMLIWSLPSSSDDTWKAGRKMFGHLAVSFNRRPYQNATATSVHTSAYHTSGCNLHIPPHGIRDFVSENLHPKPETLAWGDSVGCAGCPVVATTTVAAVPVQEAYQLRAGSRRREAACEQCGATADLSEDLVQVRRLSRRLFLGFV